MIIKGKKVLLKTTFFVLFAFCILPGIGVAAFGGFSYYQAKTLATEASNLAKVEKYDQAIEKYVLAQAKWATNSLQEEINNGLEDVQELKQQREYFEKGSAYFDEEKWEVAKEALKKIDGRSKYYEEAKRKLKIIEEKIIDEKTKSRVKGVQVTTAPASQQTVTPTPTLQGSGISPNQQAVLDGINKAIEENKAKMAEQKEILDRESKDYCPDLNLQWPDYKACETERIAKYKRAEAEFLRLQELNKELALEALKILGQI